MVTIINKSRLLQAYELDCAIPLRDGKKKELRPLKDKKNKKMVKRGGVQVQSERVLTLQAGERRTNLPDAVSQSRTIIAAQRRGEILVKKQKLSKGAEVKSKPAASSEAKPKAASNKSK